MRSSSVATPAFVMAMLLATALLAEVVKPSKRVSDARPHVELSDVIPTAFGDWREDTSIVPIHPPPDLKAVIDKTYDQTLTRTYRNADNRRVMLSVAYGVQDEGMNMHRPELCYPAQGFQIVRKTESASINTPVGSLSVKRLVAAQRMRNEPITYWIVVGDEMTSFGFRHKLTTLKYGLTGRVPDGILVRVSSIEDNNGDAFLAQEAFVVQLIKTLSPENKRRLLGAH